MNNVTPIRNEQADPVANRFGDFFIRASSGLSPDEALANAEQCLSSSHLPLLMKKFNSFVAAENDHLRWTRHGESSSPNHAHYDSPGEDRAVAVAAYAPAQAQAMDNWEKPHGIPDCVEDTHTGSFVRTVRTADGMYVYDPVQGRQLSPVVDTIVAISNDRIVLRKGELVFALGEPNKPLADFDLYKSTIQTADFHRNMVRTSKQLGFPYTSESAVTLLFVSNDTFKTRTTNTDTPKPETAVITPLSPLPTTDLFADAREEITIADTNFHRAGAAYEALLSKIYEIVSNDPVARQALAKKAIDGVTGTEHTYDRFSHVFPVVRDASGLERQMVLMETTTGTSQIAVDIVAPNGGYKLQSGFALVRDADGRTVLWTADPRITDDIDDKATAARIADAKLEAETYLADLVSGVGSNKNNVSLTELFGRLPEATPATDPGTTRHQNIAEKLANGALKIVYYLGSRVG